MEAFPPPPAPPPPPQQLPAAKWKVPDGCRHGGKKGKCWEHNYNCKVCCPECPKDADQPPPQPIKRGLKRQAAANNTAIQEDWNEVQAERERQAEKMELNVERLKLEFGWSNQEPTRPMPDVARRTEFNKREWDELKRRLVGMVTHTTYFFLPNRAAAEMMFREVLVPDYNPQQLHAARDVLYNLARFMNQAPRGSVEKRTIAALVTSMDKISTFYRELKRKDKEFAPLLTTMETKARSRAVDDLERLNRGQRLELSEHWKPQKALEKAKAENALLKQQLARLEKENKELKEQRLLSQPGLHTPPPPPPHGQGPHPYTQHTGQSGNF